jgi:dTDP-4-dehydrorhamnose 3,5-epimerase
MKVKETGIEGLILLEPDVHGDLRGYFMETYHQARLDALGITQRFVQDNQSRSVYGVIRGLHFQKEPHAQAKLIRVTEGTIYDVAVDIRPSSPTCGHWYGTELSAENHLQLLVPRGFAHGFSVLTAYATLFYKCDGYYNPESESGIRFDDPDLQIDWKINLQDAVVSDKDRNLPSFKDISNKAER